MKTFKSIATGIFILSFVFIANACIDMGTVKGNEKVISQIRDLKGFTKIEASNGINVIISMGELEKVEVKADENLMNTIITEVKNGVLKIYAKRSIKKAKSSDVFVTVKELSSISGSAGVNIKSLNCLTSADLKIDASSGSDITLSVDCTVLSCSTSSGSDVKLSGKAKEFKADSSSGSDIKAFDLAADSSTVAASSGADIKINVLKYLSAEASSGGDIHYTGNPENVKKDVSSGGGLHKE